jgi:transcription-repair coupling factor (superfamily II helicase)
MQGKGPPALTETKIEFPTSAFLPEDYVNETSLRMEIYQRLGEAVSWEDIDLIFEELRDRFGPPPEPVEWLYRLSRLKVFASQHGISLLKQDKVSLTIERQQKKQTITKKILMTLSKNPQDMEEKVLAGLKMMFS